jgi:hypothetical protein
MKNQNGSAAYQRITANTLAAQNIQYRGTGGVSAGNRCLGFVPAFKDTETGVAYRSCFADGQPAPFHMYEGLPQELLEGGGRASSKSTSNVKCSVIAGFLLDGCFFTREEAAQAVACYR